MELKFKKISQILFVLLLVTPFLFLSCGGGGGSSGSSSSSSSGSGTVAVTVADGPADEFERIWITITEISLIPSGDGDDNSVVIYRSNTGHEFDLLELRDQDFLFTVNRKVPAGRYEKIRMKNV